MKFIVIVEYMEEQSYSFDTYEDAKEFAIKQEGYDCIICKVIAYKDEYKNAIDEVEEVK